MNLHLHLHWFLALSQILFVFGEILESDNAIVIEARLEVFPEEITYPKFKIAANTKFEDDRNANTEETTVTNPVFDEITGTITPDDIVSTTPEDGEEISEFLDEPGSYPWLAEILKNGKHLCSGSVIDHRHILTTAYCIYLLKAAIPSDLIPLRVDIGFKSNYNADSSDLYEGPAISQRVKKIIYHRYFNVTTAYNDIALLQLEHSIVFDKFIRPIGIEEDVEFAENSISGFQESIIGWKINPNNTSSTPTRSEEILTRKSTKECRSNYVTILPPYGIADSMLCAGGDRLSTTCYWTFGSPLLTKSLDDPSGKQSQIGFFSWGIEALLPNCNYSETEQKPLVFTRISSFSEWIRRNLKH